MSTEELSKAERLERGFQMYVGRYFLLQYFTRFFLFAIISQLIMIRR